MRFAYIKKSLRRDLSSFRSCTGAHSKDNAGPVLVNWLEAYSASQVAAWDPGSFVDHVPVISPFLSASVGAQFRP